MAQPLARVLRTGLALGLLGLALLTLHRLLLPELLRRAVIAELSRRGIAAAELVVHPVTLQGLRVSDLRLGRTPALSIRTLELRSSPGELWSGLPPALVAEGLEWRLALGADGVDLGELTPLLGSNSPRAAEEDDAEPFSLPLRRIALRQAVVWIEGRRGRLRSQLEARLELDPDGLREVRLELGGESEDFEGARLDARLELALTPDARFTGRLAASSRPSGEHSAVADTLELRGGRVELAWQGLAPGLARLWRLGPRGALVEGASLAATLALAGEAELASGDAARADASAELTLRDGALEADASLDAQAPAFACEAARLAVRAQVGSVGLPRLDEVRLEVPGASVADLDVRELALAVRPGADAESPAALSFAARIAGAPDRSEPFPATVVSLAATLAQAEGAWQLGWADCATLELAAGRVIAGWRLARPLSLCLKAPERGLVLRPPSAGSGNEEEAWQLDAALSVPPTALDLRSGEQSVVGTSPALRLRGHLLGSERSLRIESEGGSLRLTAPTLAIADVEARADLSLPAAESASLALALQRARLAPVGPGAWWPPVSASGQLRLDAQRLALREVELRDTSGRLLVAGDARHDLVPDRGEASARMPRLAFERGGLQPADVSPALAPWVADASGGLAVEVRVGWQGGALIASGGELRLDALSLTTPWAKLEGLDAALAFDGLDPLSLPGPATLRFARLDPGVPFDAGEISFAIEGGDRIAIDSAHAELAGGRLRLAGESRLSSGRHRADLSLESVALAPLVGFAQVEGLDVEGRVDARVPLRVEGKEVRIDAGALTSTSAGGVIRYRPATPPASLLAAGSGGRMAIEALRDFRFERLTAHLDGDLERLFAQVALLGSNPAVENGRPISFELNLSTRLADLFRAWQLQSGLAERFRRHARPE